jgi:chromosome segregation ATPase
MDVDQLIKRVDWLDNERRKDKQLIAALEERLEMLDARLATSEQQNKELESEITRLAAVLIRIDHFDQSLVQHRNEFNLQLKTQEKKTEERADEITRLLRAEIRAFETSLADTRKGLEPIPGLRGDMLARLQEESRLARLIDELRQSISDLSRNEEEQSRVYRLLEDGRRQDAKRLTDLQGEVTAIRKRSDEQRGRIDIADTSLRKLETRLNELLAVEQERRNAQASFLEKQALAEVERDRTWKDWQSRFTMIERQSADLESQFQRLDTTHLTIKRIQEAVDDLMQRIERRINEIVEMQRLAEERFRQEWTTFKADDQKRWINYTLSQDEQRSDFGRRFERISGQVTYLEDALQEVQDSLYQINELTSKRLQSLLTAAHDWVAEFERTQSASR